MTKSIFTLCGFAAFLSLTAQSAPSAWTPNDSKGLNFVNPTNSTLLRDNKDPNIVWVLPPTGGEASLTNFSPSASLVMCSGLKDVMIASNAQDARLRKISEQIDAKMPDFEEKEKALIAAQEALAKLSKGNIAELTLIQDEITDLRKANDRILEDLETCTANCKELNETRKANRDRISTLEEKYDTLVDANRELVREYTRAENAVDQAQEAFNTVASGLDAIQTKQAALKLVISASLADKAKLEGGTALVNYDTGWEANVQKLEELFPQYQFNQIPTRATRIHANIVTAGSSDTYYDSLPSLLDYSILGLNFMPFGQALRDDQGALNAFPSVVSGNFRLSMMGACPLADTKFFEGVNYSAKLAASGDPIYAISATYEYPVAFAFKMTATYNLYKFYEIIQKKSSSGGFFSSKSKSEVSEKKIDKDAFFIDWDVEDPESIYSEEKRAQVASSIKDDLVARVLVTMAQPIYQGAPALPQDAGVPPTPGALVLADGLQKTCGFNIYCQAGSWILKGATAIFGSSKSESTFRSEWDREAKETWSATTVKYRPGTTGFTKR